MPRFPSGRAARGVCAHAVAGTALQNVLPLRVRRPPRGFSLRVFPRCFHPVLVRDPRVSIWQLPFSPFSSALRERVRFAPLFPPALTSARSWTSRRRRCALAGATRARIPRERSASAGLECAARIRARDTGREAERADDGSGALQRQRRAVGKGRSAAQRAGGDPTWVSTTRGLVRKKDWPFLQN